MSNPIKRVVPQAYPNAQPKRHVDRFSGFCRGHDRVRQTGRQTGHATPVVTIGRIDIVLRYLLIPMLMFTVILS